jgi:hypothetical protein
MIDKKDRVIRYKWNPQTETGYRLRFDSRRASHGGLRCYRVEEWTQHCIVDEWGFDKLSDALDVLHGFFDLDVSSEMHRIEDRFVQGGAGGRSR